MPKREKSPLDFSTVQIVLRSDGPDLIEISRIGISRVLMSSAFVPLISRTPIYRWRCPIGTFPMAPICDTRPQQMDGRDLFSQFRDMLCPGPLVSRIHEMPNHEKPMNALIGTFPESFDFCHVSLKDGRLDFRRGFAWKETRSLVFRFRDFPNPDMLMARFFSELF